MNKTLKILLKSRKAQIGTTLTWIVAFVIIFFIMLLFFVGCAFLSGEKFVSMKKNIISLDEEQNLESLHSQRLLAKILNTLVDEGKTIKDLIFEWQLSGSEDVKKKIEEEVESILDNENVDSYFFSVDSNGRDYILIDKGIIKKEEISKLSLFLNEQKINVELYISE